jgi:hypothetical protein
MIDANDKLSYPLAKRLGGRADANSVRKDNNDDRV